jgi:hypothetical protein
LQVFQREKGGPAATRTGTGPLMVTLQGDRGDSRHGGRGASRRGASRHGELLGMVDEEPLDEEPLDDTNSHLHLERRVNAHVAELPKETLVHEKARSVPHAEDRWLPERLVLLEGRMGSVESLVELLNRCGCRVKVLDDLCTDSFEHSRSLYFAVV